MFYTLTDHVPGMDTSPTKLLTKEKQIKATR
jgi:hypothetical protein